MDSLIYEPATSAIGPFTYCDLIQTRTVAGGGKAFCTTGVAVTSPDGDRLSGVKLPIGSERPRGVRHAGQARPERCLARLPFLASGTIHGLFPRISRLFPEPRPNM